MRAIRSAKNQYRFTGRKVSLKINVATPYGPQYEHNMNLVLSVSQLLARISLLLHVTFNSKIINWLIFLLM